MSSGHTIEVAVTAVVPCWALSAHETTRTGQLWPYKLSSLEDMGGPPHLAGGRRGRAGASQCHHGVRTSRDGDGGEVSAKLMKGCDRTADMAGQGAPSKPSKLEELFGTPFELELRSLVSALEPSEAEVTKRRASAMLQRLTPLCQGSRGTVEYASPRRAARECHDHPRPG